MLKKVRARPVVNALNVLAGLGGRTGGTQCVRARGNKVSNNNIAYNLWLLFFTLVKKCLSCVKVVQGKVQNLSGLGRTRFDFFFFLGGGGMMMKRF